MVPVRLTLHNFLSYGEDVPTIDFSAFRLACISGQNGHGKSALIDAITWALWGEARKGPGGRKPDPDLLRIGASEMRVEFEFDLEGTHYRVLRSFRKTGRGGTVNLELQGFDSERSSYVALSEAGSVTKTQERVESLLRMSYNTFITSSLVLQGRSDEFTTRPARERKGVLAEILGLDRYDRLVRLARQKGHQAQLQAELQRSKLTAIDTALKDRPEIEREMSEIDGFIENAEARTRDAEKALNDLVAKRSEANARLREADDIKAAMATGQAELSEALQEADRIQSQIREDETLLARRKEIASEIETHNRLRAQEAAFQNKLKTLREQESDKSRLEVKIVEARHNIERRREKWTARLKAAEETIEKSQVFTSRREEIERTYDELETARREFRLWEERRSKFEELEVQTGKLEKQIDEVRSRLDAEAKVLRGQHQDLLEKAGAEQGARADLATEKEEFERLRNLEQEANRLRDQERSLAARADQDQLVAVALETEIKGANERLDLLKKTDEANCPLCESPLDAERRESLVAQLSEDFRQKQSDSESLNQNLHEDRERLAQYHERFECIKSSTEGISDLQRRIVLLESRIAEAIQAAKSADQLAERISSLEVQIQTGSFAEDQRRRLMVLRSSIEAVGYQREAHNSIREKIEALSSVEREKARLDAAEESLKVARGNADESREKIDLADGYLKERRYAREEQAELGAVVDRIKALGYDPERHRSVSEDVERTSQALTLKERLEMAENRVGRAQEDLARVERRTDNRQRRVKELKDRLEILNRDTLDAEDFDRSIKTSETNLRTFRIERDRLLQRRGGLADRIDRCQALASERDEVEKAAKTSEKDMAVYEALTTAFGKDGIPALIIENAIPEIESEANQILSRLTANRTHVAIESLRDLKKGGTRETLDIKISDELGERQYELYSGGEAFRINFALRIALAKLLAKRAGTRLRTLILDEGFGTQDTEGLEHLIEAIQAISQDFDKVLIITHVDEIRDAFPVRIEVTKYPDLGSRFEVFQ